MRQQKQAHSQRRIARIRDEGYALVGLLALIPFLLAVILIGGLMAHALANSAQAESICDNQHMYLQEQMAKYLNQLIRRNPRALALRLKALRSKQLLAELTPTGNAVAIAAATANLARIELLRLELDREQKLILLQARLLSKQRALTIRYAMHSYTPQTAAPELAVRADIPGDIAPLYLEQPDFSKLQMSSTKYFVKVDKFNSRREKLVLRQSCAATIERRGPHYHAALARVLL